jgi:hypothetical protein
MNNDQILTEQINQYIRNRIPHMIEMIKEVAIPQNTFKNRLGLRAKELLYKGRELGYKGLNYLDKQGAQEREFYGSLIGKNTKTLADAELRRSGFKPEAVRDILQSAPTSMPRRPGRNAGRLAHDDYRAQRDAFLERQALQAKLQTAQKFNPALKMYRGQEERDISNTSTMLSKTAARLDPSNPDSPLARAALMAKKAEQLKRIRLGIANRP